MDIYSSLFNLLLRSGIGFLVTSVVSGLIFLLFNLAFYNIYFKKRKIQPTKDNPQENLLPHMLGYELKNMVLLSITSSLMGLARSWMENKRILVVTSTVDENTTRTVLWQFLLYFVLFDIYYYFLHRYLFHSKKFWWIHKAHHESLTPNPFTGFSFHPLEVLLTGGFPIVLNLFIPLHSRSLMAYNMWGLLSNLIVHCGYEIMPWIHKSWLTKWWLGSIFHDVHHSKIACNYGGFTTLWDYLFGTVHRDYEKIVSDCLSRIQSPTVPK